MSVDLICPACNNDLNMYDGYTQCLNCNNIYYIKDGIPLMFVPTGSNNKKYDVTEMVKEFYEESPFPNYEDMEESK